MTVRKKIRIGDLLVSKKFISEMQLQSALAEQKKSGRKLGHVLIELGMISEDVMLQLLGDHLQISFVDLKHYDFSVDTVRILPEVHARRYRAIVLDSTVDGVFVGMADPTDIYAFDKLSAILQRPLTLAIVREAELLKTIDLVYRRTDEISSLAEELGEEIAQSDFDLDSMLRAVDVGDAPVVKLIQSVFRDAVQMGASDVHIEPDESVLRVRQRVDGVLNEQIISESRIAPALATRLKLMAGLNIAEKRLPQDGRFSIKVADISLDVRVSTMPGQYGESVVMRLLNQSSGLLDIADLGIPSSMRSRFRRLINMPHGLTLVTGPTGSGKTTTLYAALNHLNQADRKIITAEDPVEYRMQRITQVQVNDKIELGFTSILRAILRQDPDVILIGEMRDKDTAQIGVRAAMTGHQVLSTLHTNDAVTSAPRLLDMGVDGYLAAAALRAVMSQRLVKRICESCSTEVVPDAQQQSWITSMLGEVTGGINLREGRGCPHCHNTGYYGRIGVYELLELDRAMVDALRIEDTAAFSKAAEMNAGYIPIKGSVMSYVSEGITTMAEAQHISGEMDEENISVNVNVDDKVKQIKYHLAG